jgi:hypothetical protein
VVLRELDGAARGATVEVRFGQAGPGFIRAPDSGAAGPPPDTVAAPDLRPRLGHGLRVRDRVICASHDPKLIGQADAIVELGPRAAVCTRVR